MPAEKDYYDILGVRSSAQQPEIELALKGRRTQYHPDKYADADVETQQWATAKMQEVNEAYRVLSDAGLRRAFDARRDGARDEGSAAHPNTRTPGSWSKFRPRGARRRRGADHPDHDNDDGFDLAKRMALIQRQLAIDFEKTKAEFVDQGAELGSIDADDAFVLSMITFTPRECGAVVSRNLQQLPFVQGHVDLNAAIGCAQFLAAILAFHSLSMTPASVIDGMGKDSYYRLQGFPLRQFERCLDEFCGRGSDFHLDIAATTELTMGVLAGIIGVPRHEPLKVELRGTREDFVPAMLEDEPFHVPRELTRQLLREAEDVNRQWLQKCFDAMLQEDAQKHTFRTCNPRSAPPPFFRSTSGGEYHDSGSEPVILDYLRDLSLSRADAERFHLAPDIPPKKLATALGCRRFASSKPPAKVYLLVDDTAFQGGAEGLVITNEFISFKSLFLDSVDYLYSNGWNDGFSSNDAVIMRFGKSCKTFSQVSAPAVQSLVWGLNKYFADRLKWYEARAERGDVNAQFFMSNSSHGDPDSAMRWLMMAARSGHPTAQHNLGMHYIGNDNELAFQWLTKAAQQGVRQSQQVLQRDIFRNFYPQK